MGAIRDFMDHHYRHFNARETVAAARAWEDHLEAGGKMMVTLAGAMSTGELGVILARMIREGKVHGICCTGANLEEDVFNLLAAKDYVEIPNWRALRAEDEKALYDRGLSLTNNLQTGGGMLAFLQTGTPATPPTRARVLPSISACSGKP